MEFQHQSSLIPSWIIAEVGVNHNGKLELAKKLVDVAYESGCDSVKFQVFNPVLLTTSQAKQAQYQIDNSQENTSQQKMLCALTLTENEFIELKQYCDAKPIGFLATPFDHQSLRFITEKLECEIIKIGSGDLTDGPLLLAAARQGCHIILSTGMSTLSEIEKALSLLAFGYINTKDNPTDDTLLKAFMSVEGQSALQQHVSLLHCCSQYPTSPKDVNLLAMTTLHQAFHLPVGYSDHTLGTAISMAAVTLGASIIEKHITLDNTMSGPDHKASLMPAELKKLVSGIRDIEASLGHGLKFPVIGELTMREHARKSLVTKRALKKGETLKEDALTAKRPGTGISPMSYWHCLNKTVHEAYAEDELIHME